MASRHVSEEFPIPGAAVHYRQTGHRDTASHRIGIALAGLTFMLLSESAQGVPQRVLHLITLAWLAGTAVLLTEHLNRSVSTNLGSSW